MQKKKKIQCLSMIKNTQAMKRREEFPLWLSGLQTRLVSIRIQAHPWPGSVGWGYGVATSCGVGADAARILCCGGCGVGQQLHLQLDP